MSPIAFCRISILQVWSAFSSFSLSIWLMQHVTTRLEKRENRGSASTHVFESKRQSGHIYEAQTNQTNSSSCRDDAHGKELEVSICGVGCEASHHLVRWIMPFILLDSRLMDAQSLAASAKREEKLVFSTNGTLLSR